MAADGGTGDRPAAARPAGGPDLAFLVAAGIALVAAGVLVRNLLPAKRALADNLLREEGLKREIEALRIEKELLDLRQKGLLDDDAYKERVLRAQTGMTRPGEFIVR